MEKPIRFVSETVSKILDLVAEKKMSVEAAIEIFDTMKANGFTENHVKFFESLKELAKKGC
jgi:DNA polymerase IIIc chi subunit